MTWMILDANWWYPHDLGNLHMMVCILYTVHAIMKHHGASKKPKETWPCFLKPFLSFFCWGAITIYNVAVDQKNISQWTSKEPCSKCLTSWHQWRKCSCHCCLRFASVRASLAHGHISSYAELTQHEHARVKEHKAPNGECDGCLSMFIPSSFYIICPWIVYP